MSQAQIKVYSILYDWSIDNNDQTNSKETNKVGSYSENKQEKLRICKNKCHRHTQGISIHLLCEYHPFTQKVDIMTCHLKHGTILML